MNLKYFLVLFIFIFVSQIPCFLILSILYPLIFFLKLKFLLKFPRTLIFSTFDLLDKLFFNVKFINDGLIDTKNKRYIYLANHQAYLDPIIARKAMISSDQYLVTIVISYAKYVPLLGMNLYMLGIPFYHYDKSGKSINKGLVQMYTEYLKENSSAVLTMFPEGKRVFSNEFKLENIRSGGFIIAKNTNSDIVPVYHNIKDRFDDVKREYNSVAKIYCIYGTTISTENKDIDDIKKEYYESMLKLKERIEKLKN